MSDFAVPAGGQRDRALGVLLGLAAGDRNGGPIEMAVRLAESLAERRAFDPRDVLQRYLAWHRAGSFDTGPVTGMVLALIDGGVDSEEAVRRIDQGLDGQTAGCNPAHRVAPLAMAAFLPGGALADAARAEALLTHHHPVAGDTAAAVVVLCRGLIRGSIWEDALARAADGCLPEVAGALDPKQVRVPSPRGFAPEALGAAVHFVCQADSLDQALEAGFRFAGPANYCPVLVGAIGGARWGRSAVEARLLEHCRDLRRLERVAEELAGDWPD